MLRVSGGTGIVPACAAAGFDRHAISQRLAALVSVARIQAFLELVARVLDLIESSNTLGASVVRRHSAHTQRCRICGSHPHQRIATSRGDRWPKGSRGLVDRPAVL